MQVKRDIFLKQLIARRKNGMVKFVQGVQDHVQVLLA